MFFSLKSFQNPFLERRFRQKIFFEFPLKYLNTKKNLNKVQLFPFLQKSFNVSLNSLFSFNFFFGTFLKKSKFFYLNFFLGLRFSFFIFNLEYTIFLLRKSLNFILTSLLIDGHFYSYLIFCSNIFFRPFFFNFLSSKSDSISFIVGPWIHGFLTNFSSCKNIFSFFKGDQFNLKFKTHKLLFEKLKFFKLRFHQRKGRFIFPHFSFLLESNLKNKGFISECNFLSVPVVGLADSDELSANIEYTIPCNNKSFLTSRCVLFLFKRCLFFSLYNVKENFLNIKNFLFYLKNYNFFCFFLEKNYNFLNKRSINLQHELISKLFYLKKKQRNCRKKVNLFGSPYKRKLFKLF